MDLGVLFSRLRRRWYVLLIGLLVAAGLGATTWSVFPHSYERTASQVLLPGPGTVPVDNNPYFYLSGLEQAADVIVLAVGSDNVRTEISHEFPDATFEVSRDPTTSGPVILITVDARTDETAATVLQRLIDTTAVELKRLQEADQVTAANQITVTVVSQDTSGALKRRNQLVATVGVVALTLLITVLLAAFVDGSRKRPEDQPAEQSEESSGAAADSAPDEPDEPDEPGKPDEQSRPEQPAEQPSDDAGALAAAVATGYAQRPAHRRHRRRRVPGDPGSPDQRG